LTTNSFAILDWLSQHSDDHDGSWALTGLHAAQRHGLSTLTHLHSKPVEIVVNSTIAEHLQRWQLQVAPAPSPTTLLITRAALPLTSFLGVTSSPGQPPMVDPWQAALAVANDPQRGIEQATAIADTLWLAD
jgi:hypothetical protein